MSNHDNNNSNNHSHHLFNAAVAAATAAANNDTAAVWGFAAPLDVMISIVVGLATVLCSVVTVVGNLLVVLAFFLERTLRTPTNYFIASLAVTDILIGIFSMNLFSLYLLLGYWPLGDTLCDIWLCLDYTLCLTSQYTVLLITVDRFCSVKIPAKYRNWRTARKVKVMVSLSWVIPTVIFVPSILGWPRQRASDACYAEFTSNAVFNTLLTIAYFWVTLIVMCSLYVGIYQVALNLQKKADNKRQQLLRHMMHHSSNVPKSVNGTVSAAASPSESPRQKDGGGKMPRDGKTPVGQPPGGGANDSSTADSHQPADIWTFSRRFLLPMPRILRFTRDLRPKQQQQPSSLKKTTGSQIMSEQSSSKVVRWELPEDSRMDDNTDLDTVIPMSPLSIQSLQEEGIYCVQDRKSKNSVWIHQNPLHCMPAASEAASSDNQNSSIQNEDDSNMPSLISVDQNSSNPSKLSISLRRVRRRLQRQSGYSADSGSRTAGEPKTKKKVQKREEEDRRRVLRHENRALKALRTITIILGAFTTCWTPYHILVLVKGFCVNACVSDALYNVAYWLCYLNSPINPFCYALANTQFKKSFLRLIRLDFRRR